jgi:hypothetical protein
MGDGHDASGGVVRHGASEEDGPGTWEALPSPREVIGHAGSPPRISDGLAEDPRSKRLDCPDQALAVRDDVESHPGGGNDVEVEPGEADPCGPADSLEAAADKVERVLGREEPRLLPRNCRGVQ